MRKMRCSLLSSGVFSCVRISRSRAFVFLFAFWLCSSLAESSSWIPRHFPNPMVNPLACGRRKNVSWVCDPDRVMDDASVDRIDEALERAHNGTRCHCRNRGRCSGFGGYRFGVAVIANMRESFTSSHSSSKRASREFAKDVRRQWFRDLGCDDNVLILFIKEDDQVSISVGRMTRLVLTSNEIVAIYKNTQVLFQEENCEWGLLRVIQEVAQNINDAVTARVENAIGLAFFGGVLLFAFGVLVFCFRSGRCQGEKKMTFPLGAPMGFRRSIQTPGRLYTTKIVPRHGRQGRRQTVIALTGPGRTTRL